MPKDNNKGQNAPRLNAQNREMSLSDLDLGISADDHLEKTVEQVTDWSIKHGLIDKNQDLSNDSIQQIKDRVRTSQKGHLGIESEITNGEITIKPQISSETEPLKSSSSGGNSQPNTSPESTDSKHLNTKGKDDTNCCNLM